MSWKISCPWKRQWCRSFTVLSSAGKSAKIEKRLFFRRRGSSQNIIAMGKAPEPADDVGMILGIAEIVAIARVTKQFDAALLVGQMLRMHERHVEKFQQGRLDTLVRAARDGAGRDLATSRASGSLE
jgi:hypothetical protein